MPGPQPDDPLAALGLTTAKAKELNRHLQTLQDALDEPYAAMDSMLEVSSISLDRQGDNARVYLMGGGILDSLADLICICDEDWISGEQSETNTNSEHANADDDDDDASHAEHKSSLELCSRALNTLGSMCTFNPFLQSILEEDWMDTPLEQEVIEALRKHINDEGGSGSGGSSEKFQLRGFGPGLRVLHFPLLCATLFWLSTRRFPSCRAQAVFAMSWLLTDANIVKLLVPAGVIEVVFRVLKEQVPDVPPPPQPLSALDALFASIAPLPPSAPSPAPESIPASERVSVTQENLRLYACICMQRLSRSSFPLFADQPEQIAHERLEMLLKLLSQVQSFNIRAILLHVLLKAVTPIPSASSSSTAVQSGLLTPPSASKTDLSLPLSSETITALRSFRSSCGSIGSSQSSRRTSPALDALASGRSVPPIGTSMYSVPSTSAVPPRSSYAASVSSRSGSSRTTPIPQEMKDDGQSHAGEVEDDDDVGELLRDLEQQVDKTTQLQTLVDAIFAAAGVKDETTTAAASPAALS